MPAHPIAALTEPQASRGKPRLAEAWAVAWRMTAFFTLWGMVLAPAVLPRAWLQELGKSSPAQLRFYFDCTGLFAALLASAVMRQWVDRGLPLGFAPARAAADGLRGLAGGAAWLGVSLGLVALAGGVRFAPQGAFAWPALLLAAASLALNAALQETVARGYVFQMVRRRAGPGWAVTVTSVVFCAMHAGAFRGALLPAVNVCAASVLFGLVLLRTGTLWAVIALHFAWNFLTGPVLGLAVSGRDLADGWQVLGLHGPAWLTGGAFGLEGSAVVTLVTVAAGVAAGRGLRSGSSTRP